MSERSFAVLTQTPAQTRAVGKAIGALFGPGDLVILSGGLAAGKTTLTQGIAEGVGVRGPITSPTFVIARTHPSLRPGGGPAMVHVDAYRLGGVDELDDIDLDTDLGSAVTIVEWGAGLADQLSVDRLLIALEPVPEQRLDDSAPTPAANPAAAGVTDDDVVIDVSQEIEEPRLVTISASGQRWTAEAWSELHRAASSAPGHASADPAVL